MAGDQVACRSRLPRARLRRMIVRKPACVAASWTSRSETPAPGAAVMDVCGRVRPGRLGDTGATGHPAERPGGHGQDLSPLPRPVLPVRKTRVEVTRVPVMDDSGAARHRAADHPRTAGPLALGTGVAAGQC